MRYVIILGVAGFVFGLLGTIANWDKVTPSTEWYPIALIVLTIPSVVLGGKLKARNPNTPHPGSGGRRIISADRLTMKYMCFGYGQEKVLQNKRAFFIERCSSYVEELKRAGCFIEGEVLEDSQNTAAVRSRGGKISVTAGPYRKSKEQFKKFILIEAKDLNHAIRLISKHPSLELGETWEIRPVARRS